MTVLSVVQDVCQVVGVQHPTSLFSGIATNRTAQELAALANEMAQRISYDLRDWTMFRKRCDFTGGSGVDDASGTYTSFLLPADYKRMLLTANVRNSTTPRTPMLFINDYDEWIARRLNNEIDPRGEWTIVGGSMLVSPIPASGVTISFPYLERNCVKLTSGGNGDRFVADTDSFRLDERLLKLGMIYQWKAQKGSPYAEDMGTFGDAVSIAMGKDSPAPIIIDSRPSSWSATVSAPFPPGWGPAP
jgi:hypothetical protein